MVSSFGLVTVAFGAAMARVANQLTLRTEMMETIAGFLLIGGFAAIGCALPMI